MVALRMVAEMLARAGEIERAIEAAQRIDAPHYRIGALNAVGMAQARAGLQAAAQATFGEALQVAQSFQNEDRGYMLKEIASAQARAGMTAEALQTASFSATVKEVVEVLLVQALAERGSADEAIRMALHVGGQYPYLRERLLGALVVWLTRAGHGAAAMQVAGDIAPNSERVKAFARIALVFRQGGADGDAARAVRSAMRAAASEPDNRAMCEALATLSYTLPD